MTNDKQTKKKEIALLSLYCRVVSHDDDDDTKIYRPPKSIDRSIDRRFPSIIMSTPQFRAGNPLAPEKGAFPLDHFGECTATKEKYLECLRVRVLIH
jgi:hypothetical protein